jgi:ATP synthase protein I
MPISHCSEGGAAASGKQDMTASEPPQDPELPRDARLNSLDERLRQAQQAETERSGSARPDDNYRLGMRVLGELVGAPFGGAVIGFVLDRWLETRPLFLLALLFLGFGVGIRNVIRLSKTRPGNGPGAGS